MQLRMAVLASSEAEDTGEMAVYNKRSRQMRFYGIGDAFDGGKLVYVHPTGAVAHRSKQYYIYKMGFVASEDRAIDDVDESFALDYPRLVQMADWMKRRDAAAVAEAETKKKPKETVPDKKPSAAQPSPGKQPDKKVKPVPIKRAKKKDAAADRGGTQRRGGSRAARRRAAQKPRVEHPPLTADEMARIEKEYAASQEKKAKDESSKDKKSKSDSGAKKKPD